jgi:hypothetical protein
MSENRAVSETYITDDAAADERRRHRAALRSGRIDDADERTTIERTEAEQSAFAAKMAEWRRTGGIPSYTGPRAAR